jgi:predicted nucleic acid-binding Zn ribbon protein
MVRRLAPRRLAAVLPEAVRVGQPPTMLARAQAFWPDVAGRGLAAAAAPVAEREGVVTVACESAVWAHELQLLGDELAERLNLALGAAGNGRVERLRFVVRSPPN